MYGSFYFGQPYFGESLGVIVSQITNSSYRIRVKNEQLNLNLQSEKMDFMSKNEYFNVKLTTED